MRVSWVGASTAVIGVSAGVVVPTAADAATPPPATGMARCPAGSLCTWALPGFAGAMTRFVDDGNWAGQCSPMREPVKSVANLTSAAPWRMTIFLFHGTRVRPCEAHGLYAQSVPGATDPNVRGGPVTGVRIYADPGGS